MMPYRSGIGGGTKLAKIFIAAIPLLLTLTASHGATVRSRPSELSALPKLAEVDERYQSYNVEMVEVTGGRFWAPYGGPAGEVYRMRAPLDLANIRLRNLAKNLGPAYMRVSGTWANNTYLPAAGETTTTPPEGYKQILTRDQWRGVIAFSKAVGAKIVTSFAAGDGTRDSDKIWKTEQAQRFVDLTEEAGGKIAAAEFFNEPNAATMGGLPKGYTANDYGRDFQIFRNWAKQAVPAMKIIGPGGVGEGALGDIPVNALPAGMILSTDMMVKNPNSLDAVSYHFYGNVSQRCAAMRPKTANKDEALTPAWLDLTLRDYNYYSALRDKYEPGKPMWVTETAQAACGGSPWASTFLDSFRYLNQLGLLAQKGVQVVMHNTLAASDYSLIDHDTLNPRPNYWAALLWKRVMGNIVLAS
ncbi:MAG: hypothetical protein ABIU18_09830, partial [Novosphingobium sp.]